VTRARGSEEWIRERDGGAHAHERCLVLKLAARRENESGRERDRVIERAQGRDRETGNVRELLSQKYIEMGEMRWGKRKGEMETKGSHREGEREDVWF